MTKKQLDDAVQKELVRMFKKDPVKTITFLLIQMGKMCVEANAATADIKTESTLSGKRYEVKSKITVKEIKMPQPPKK